MNWYLSAFVFVLLLGAFAMQGAGIRQRSFSRKKRFKSWVEMAKTVGGMSAIYPVLTVVTGGSGSLLTAVILFISTMASGLLLAFTVTFWPERRHLPKGKPDDDPQRSAICVIVIDDALLSMGAYFGNGFFIAEDLVVTAYHILKVIGRYGVHTKDGPFPFEPIALDPENDLMLLRVGELRSPHTSLQLADRSEEVSLGDEVVRMSYTNPAGRKIQWQSRHGTVTWKGCASLFYEPEAPPTDERWNNGRQVLVADLQSQRGDSGSAILKGDKVVGILTNGEDNKIVFTPVGAIHALLAQAKISLNG